MKPFKCQLLIFLFLFALNTLTAQQSKEERKNTDASRKVIDKTIIENSGNKLKAQDKLPPKIQKLLGGAKFIEGGTFTSGIFPNISFENCTQAYKNDTSSLNMITHLRRITHSSFYMCETEVSNAQYKEFVNWVIDSIAHSKLGHFIKIGDKDYIDWSKELDWTAGKGLDGLFFDNKNLTEQRSIDVSKIVYSSGSYSNKPISIYPDTLCWVRDFPYAYNEVMTKNYFSNPAYNDYPVVGVSWEQAMAYCDWKNVQVNKLLRKLGYNEIKIQLPTEMQWEFAATVVNNESVKAYFPWDIKYNAKFIDEKCRFKANFGPIIDETGFEIKGYADDGMLYTSKIRSFPAHNGLYDLAGNVDEWTNDEVNPSDFSSYLEDRFFKPGSGFAKKLCDKMGWNVKEVSYEEYAKKHVESIVEKNDEKAFSEFLKIVFNQISEDENNTTAPELLQNEMYNLVKEMSIVNDAKRIAKGGSWNSSLVNLAIGSRRVYSKDKGYSFVGFRMAFSIEKDAK